MLAILNLLCNFCTFWQFSHDGVFCFFCLFFCNSSFLLTDFTCIVSHCIIVYFQLQESIVRLYELISGYKLTDIAMKLCLDINYIINNRQNNESFPEFNFTLQFTYQRLKIGIVKGWILFCNLNTQVSEFLCGYLK